MSQPVLIQSEGNETTKESSYVLGFLASNIRRTISQGAGAGAAMRVLQTFPCGENTREAQKKQASRCVLLLDLAKDVLASCCD